MTADLQAQGYVNEVVLYMALELRGCLRRFLSNDRPACLSFRPSSVS